VEEKSQVASVIPAAVLHTVIRMPNKGPPSDHFAHGTSCVCKGSALKRPGDQCQRLLSYVEWRVRVCYAVAVGPEPFNSASF
jgi:hypothetical protein